MAYVGLRTCIRFLNIASWMYKYAALPVIPKNWSDTNVNAVFSVLMGGRNILMPPLQRKKNSARICRNAVAVISFRVVSLISRKVQSSCIKNAFLVFAIILNKKRYQHFFVSRRSTYLNACTQWRKNNVTTCKIVLVMNFWYTT